MVNEICYNTNMLLEVTPSATNKGKQVISTTRQITLKSITLTPSAANTTIKIRDGNASGEVVFYARLSATGNSRSFKACHKFTKGMHVNIIGVNAVAYLVLE